MKVFFNITFAMLCCLFMKAQDNGYQPLVREGVKWVYYEEFYGIYTGNPELYATSLFRYYTIEFRGDTVINGKSYKKGFRTSDVDFNAYNSAFYTSDDYPISYVREGTGKDRRWVYAITNTAVPSERMDFAEYLWQYDSYYYDFIMGNEYPLYYFKEDEDMVLAGEVAICGQPCEVYYWRAERIVESVGEDGYFGDLLRPFRLPMDSNSVGRLHHVEDAEGNIIYKGLGYLDDGGVSAADIDRSGLVDIDDLNFCINRILNPGSVDVRCDVTGDGLVDIDDVNAIINDILYNSNE